MVPTSASASACGLNRIQMLGDFSVVINGREITRWRAGRARQLFQFLTANIGKPISRLAIIDAIWGESGGRSPEVSLKVAVYTLRKLLLEIPAPADSGPPVRIESWGGGYQLEVYDTEVDVVAFEDAMNVAIAAENAGRTEAAADAYQLAIDCYAGPYLPQCHDCWAMIRRERLRDLALQALDRVARTAYQQGDLFAAAYAHQRMLDIDPCREQSYRELMRYHAAVRQPTRVKQWYQTCVEQLNGHLGLEPDKQTRQAFFDAMRSSIA